MTELSAERGYEATSVSEIAKRARVGSKTLYDAYSSKEELFLAAVDAAFAAALDHTAKACAARGRKWRQRLDAGLAGLLTYLGEHPAQARLLIVEAPAATGASGERYWAAEARFTALLRHAIPASGRPSQARTEAIVGGVVLLLWRKIRRGEAERLADLLPEVTKFVLAQWD